METSSKKRSINKKYLLQPVVIAIAIFVAAFVAIYGVFSIVYSRTEKELRSSITEESSQSFSLATQEISSLFSREWLLLTD